MLVQGKSNLTISDGTMVSLAGVMGRLGTIRAFGGDLGHSRLHNLGVGTLFYEAFYSFYV